MLKERDETWKSSSQVQIFRAFEPGSPIALHGYCNCDTTKHCPHTLQRALTYIDTQLLVLPFSKYPRPSGKTRKRATKKKEEGQKKLDDAISHLCGILFTKHCLDSKTFRRDSMHRALIQQRKGFESCVGKRNCARGRWRGPRQAGNSGHLAYTNSCTQKCSTPAFKEYWVSNAIRKKFFAKLNINARTAIQKYSAPKNKAPKTHPST